MEEQTGYGWRKPLGATLIGVGGLGTLGNLDRDPVSGILGGLILGGVGSALIHSAKKKKGGQYGSGSLHHVDMHISKNLKKLLRKSPHHIKGKGLRLAGQGLKLAGQGKKPKKVTNEDIKNFIHRHKDKKIHISDILGKNWRTKIKPLQQKWNEGLKRYKEQTGEGIFGDIGRAFKKGTQAIGKFSKKAIHKAGHEMKRFIDGKTSFKPSTLLNYASGAVGLAGTASAFIPGVDLISVPAASALALGLKSGAHILKTSGRGNEYGSGFFDDLKMPENLPVRYKNYIKKYPTKTKEIAKHAQKGSGLNKKSVIAGSAIGATGLALLGYLKKNPEIIRSVLKVIGMRGTGNTYHGGAYERMPEKLQKFYKKYPDLTKKIAGLVKSGKGFQAGSGKIGRLLGSLGLVGTTAAGTAYAMYQYLLANPSVAAKIAAKGTAQIIKQSLGSGLSLAGGAKYKRKKGMIIGTKKDVWDDNKPHKITSGGLMKKDLMVGKGNKIISKKRHELGKQLYKKNKNKLTPFR